MSSLDNALAILALLNRARPLLRVGEVCRELQLPKSSVSRLLRTMAEGRLIERANDDTGYSVGPLAFRLGGLYANRFDLVDVAKNAVDALVARFGFTGYVAALSGPHIVLLHVRQGSYPLRHVREVGSSLPAESTAMGQALLARLPNRQIQQRLAGAARPDLFGKLRSIRRNRVAVAASVLTPGITTVASAVGDPASGNALALALAWPDSAANRSQRNAIRAQMLVAAAGVGKRAKDPFWAK